MGHVSGCQMDGLPKNRAKPNKHRQVMRQQTVQLINVYLEVDVTII